MRLEVVLDILQGAVIRHRRTGRGHVAFHPCHHPGPLARGMLVWIGERMATGTDPAERLRSGTRRLLGSGSRGGRRIVARHTAWGSGPIIPELIRSSSGHPQVERPRAEGRRTATAPLNAAWVGRTHVARRRLLIVRVVGSSSVGSEGNREYRTPEPCSPKGYYAARAAQ